MDLSDIPKIRGPLKYVGYVGVIVMMGGLGAFAFGLLSVLGTMGSGRVPSGFPPLAIYGFGVAVVGAIIASIAVGLGEKDEEPLIHVGHRFSGHFEGDIDASGPIDARISINQQRFYVQNIDAAVQGLRPGRARRAAEAAADDVADAVERGDDDGVADALGRLTDILQAAGAFAVAGNTAAPAIIALARTIGSAGHALLNWFGV